MVALGGEGEGPIPIAPTGDGAAAAADGREGVGPIDGIHAGPRDGDPHVARTVGAQLERFVVAPPLVVVVRLALDAVDAIPDDDDANRRRHV